MCVSYLHKWNADQLPDSTQPRIRMFCRQGGAAGVCTHRGIDPVAGRETERERGAAGVEASDGVMEVACYAGYRGRQAGSEPAAAAPAQLQSAIRRQEQPHTTDCVWVVCVRQAPSLTMHTISTAPSPYCSTVGHAE